MVYNLIASLDPTTYHPLFRKRFVFDREYPINFSGVRDERLATIRSQFGSVRQYIRQKHLQGENAPEGALEEARRELTEQTNRPPQLTESDESYTTQKRRARRAAFRKEVLAAYDGSCAVCDRRRESYRGPPTSRQRTSIHGARTGLTTSEMDSLSVDSTTGRSTAGGSLSIATTG